VEQKRGLAVIFAIHGQTPLGNYWISPLEMRKTKRIKRSRSKSHGLKEAWDRPASLSSQGKTQGTFPIVSKRGPKREISQDRPHHKQMGSSTPVQLALKIAPDGKGATPYALVQPALNIVKYQLPAQSRH
jgi:hypothetical protein